MYANANPSHLHPLPPNPILQRVKSTETSAGSPVPLAQLRRGDLAVVSGLAEAAGLDDGKGSGAALLSRLRDLGFVPGAHCEVVARMWPGGDPMAVRVGGSTFALRKAEAAAVHVTLLAGRPIHRPEFAPKRTSPAPA
jgi:ferrous iron transport protein A